MQQENTVFTRPLRLGLLVDAESFSGAHAPRMLTRVKQLGRPIIRRAYGDWTTSQLALWKGALHTLAIRPCQQFHYRHGRNASDAALIMDAMEMLHERRVDGLCLASTDSDFTGLAARYQEAGLLVFGFGTSNAAAPFKESGVRCVLLSGHTRRARRVGAMTEASTRPEPQRLAKRLAAQISCSRRDAELYIAGGWVRVDGAVVEEPMARVRDEQAVVLDSQARLEPLVPVTLVWHKPAGQALPEEPFLPDEIAVRWFASGARSQGDRSGVRPLKAHGHKLLPVSPLEVLASGLMVFTQNPGVARKITDASSPLEHEWLVEVQDDPELDDGARREAVLQSLGKALFFDGWAVPAARASWQSERRLRLAIKGTLPGQVAHLAERAGLRLASVRRQRLGRIGLDGLPSGQWRYLAAHERF